MKSLCLKEHIVWGRGTCMKKFILREIQKKYNHREKLVAITAYDLFTARIANEAGADILLVGDSLGNVIQGKDTTIPVQIDHVIYHGDIVVRNAPDCLVIIDMPFGAVGVSVEESVANCVRVFKETEAGAVKFEGAGDIMLQTIQRLADIGVPVMGHLGFTPQSVNLFGGFKVDGKNEQQVETLFQSAKALEKAGAFSIVLECVIDTVAKKLSEELSIPTIGIGSGSDCDGQIIVVNDILGMGEGKLPSFVRLYENFFEKGKHAVSQYAHDVRHQKYPSDKESYHKS